MSSEEKQELQFHGIAASHGVAHGPAYIYQKKELEIPQYQIGEDRIAGEIARFEQALMETRRQIGSVRAQLAERLSEEEALIFDAHLLVLEDNALIEETVRELHDTRYNIEHVFQNVAHRYIEAFANIDDDYIKERVADIRDVSQRLLRNLTGQHHAHDSNLLDGKIIVASDVSPSDTALFDHTNVKAIVTDLGSRTSHAVIMARSLGVPSVVGLHNLTEKVSQGDDIIVDGYDGIVIVNPSEDNLYRYGKISTERENIQRVFDASANQPSITADGQEVQIQLNIEGFEEIDFIKQSGAAGVGLFRTEGIFLRGDTFPGEEEQFQAYAKIVSGLSPMPVTIRTLDLGGDKTMRNGPEYHERNPFLGYRAIRFCLEHPEIFKEQLRAILRASAFGKVKMMYPMISSLDELHQANHFLEKSREELRQRGVHFDENMAVGTMIEVPAAALTADLLAAHCDFFSIGTNDLIQYLLAVDRVNDRIAHLYEPNHPAVMRTIKQVIDAAHSYNIPVSICGEMAGEPMYSGLLLGLGADELSVSNQSLSEIKYMIRHMGMGEARKLAEEVLTNNDPIGNYKLARTFYKQHIAAVFPNGRANGNGNGNGYGNGHDHQAQE